MRWRPEVTLQRASSPAGCGFRFASVLLAAALSAQTSRPAPFLRPLRELDLAGGPVSAVALTRDGRVAASAGANGAVHLHDVATRARLAAFAAGDGRITQLAFAPAGDRLAVVGEDLSFWSVPQGRLLARHRAELAWDERSQTAAAWSADGRWFAWPDGGRRVTVLDAVTLAPVASADCGARPACALAFVPDGSTLFVARPEHATCSWHWRSGGSLEPLADGGHDATLGMAAGGRLVRGRWWPPQLASGERHVPVPADRLAIAPAADRVAAGCWSTDRVTVYEDSGRILHELVVAGAAGPCFALGPGGLAVTGGASGTVQLWRDGAPAALLSALPATAYHLAFSGDGTRLALGSGGRAVAFDVATGRRERDLPPCGALANGSSGREIAILRGDGPAHVDLETGAERGPGLVPDEPLFLSGDAYGGIAWSADGARFACNQNGWVWLGDRSGAGTTTVARYDVMLQDVAWSPAGVAAVAVEHRERCSKGPRWGELWLVPPGEAPRELPLPAGELALAVAWTAAGDLVVAGRDHLARRTPPTFEEAERVPGRVRWLRRVDGNRALAHDGERISLWSLDPLAPLAQLTLPSVPLASGSADARPRIGGEAWPPRITAAALSPDGRRVAFAGPRSVHVFDVLE